MPNMPTKNPYTGPAAEAYEKGWNRGHGIACHNVPSLGDRLFIDSLGRVTIDADNIREAHEALCFEAASNSRSFSPFEFTAHEFNSSDDPEALWEAFDAGETDAIRDDLSSSTDADYGLED